MRGKPEREPAIGGGGSALDCFVETQERRRKDVGSVLVLEWRVLVLAWRVVHIAQAARQRSSECPYVENGGA